MRILHFGLLRLFTKDQNVMFVQSCLQAHGLVCVGLPCAFSVVLVLCPIYLVFIFGSLVCSTCPDFTLSALKLHLPIVCVIFCIFLCCVCSPFSSSFGSSDSISPVPGISDSVSNPTSSLPLPAYRAASPIPSMVHCLLFQLPAQSLGFFTHLTNFYLLQNDTNKKLHSYQMMLIINKI